MVIHDYLIRGLTSSTRPVVIYRNNCGEFVCGFVLRPDEFITSLPQMAEMLKMAGLSTFDDVSNPI